MCEIFPDWCAFLWGNSREGSRKPANGPIWLGSNEIDSRRAVYFAVLYSIIVCKRDGENMVWKKLFRGKLRQIIVQSGSKWGLTRRRRRRSE